MHGDELRSASCIRKRVADRHLAALRRIVALEFGCFHYLGIRYRSDEARWNVSVCAVDLPLHVVH